MKKYFNKWALTVACMYVGAFIIFEALFRAF